jgi:hypothetical protein
MLLDVGAGKWLTFVYHLEKKSANAMVAQSVSVSGAVQTSC